RDFTTHYQEAGKGKSFDALYQMLNRISEAFERISLEKEIQHRYLEMLVDHVQVGILSYDSHEKIHLANTALKKLLQRPVLMQIDALAAVDEALVSTVRQLKTGDTKLLKIRIGKDLLQLSLHASEFKLDNEYFKLVSMQNIHTELDAREMEAWQKLIRVMTHEIMNSIAPITSLSSTLHGLVRQHQKSLQSMEKTTVDALDQGLEAIKFRSEGLHYFTEAYRSLTRIPQPSFRLASIKDILQRVAVLFEQELSRKNIILETKVMVPEVLMDPELIEQVIINLLRNSLEAVEGSAHPVIKIQAVRQSNGKTLIQIADNGMGIDNDVMENIFIPFFTTKRNGSGIGLALVKQIIQLHHGEIKVSSSVGNGAEFSILL
ncbi:MAG: ATP-binding protein, partial [Marivirga sp.]|nr:ATP-binding protein [Marivirga sp.]